MKKNCFGIIISLLLIFLTGRVAHSTVISSDLQAKLQSLGPDEAVSVIILLQDRADLSKFKSKRRALRRKRIISALKSKAELTQRPLRSFLHRHKGRKIRSLWLINGIAFTTKAKVISKLAKHPAIAEIKLDQVIPLVNEPSVLATMPEWNIGAINAPDVWALGYTGQGVVVASMDTGVDVNHPDLAGRFRGGSNSWFDPHGEHATPFDSHPVAHGTGVTSIMVGGDAGGTAIGVAPGAQWIAVKIFNDANTTTTSAIHAGFQWLLDPDNDPNTDDAPDVVNNSWGAVFADRNKCFLNFQADILALKAAGVAVVFAAGNFGPAPFTSISPANNPGAFAVGATNILDNISSFSSRGPSACDGSVFPHVVAPGQGVLMADRTIFPGSLSYHTNLGTSFASPHVVGAMALLLSSSPDLTVADLESLLQQSAWDMGDLGPDNDYGHGLIDVMGALSLTPGANLCRADFDNDGDVDLTDLRVFGSDFRRTDCFDGPPCEGDFDNDGDADLTDLRTMGSEFRRRDCIVGSP